MNETDSNFFSIDTRSSTIASRLLISNDSQEFAICACEYSRHRNLQYCADLPVLLDFGSSSYPA